MKKKTMMKRALALSLFLSSFILQPSAFSAGDTPIKNAKVSGTSAITGGTFNIQTGVVMTFLAGSTLDVSLGTLTLAINQIGWTKVSKTGSSLLDLATRSAADLNSGTVAIARLPTGTGSSNVAVGGVITAAGPIGDATHIPQITYNAAGQLTAVSTVPVSGGSGNTGSATLTYVSDGDSNGVFYFIGSKFGSQAWANPQTAGNISVTASNLAGGTVAAIVDRAVSDVFDNNNLSGPWFVFDLGVGKSLIPNKASFRAWTGSGLFYDSPLDLQGSNDGGTWTALVTGQTTAGTSNAWTSFTVTGSTAYRYFRLIRTGVTNYFSIGEFELYGAFTYPPGTPYARVYNSAAISLTTATSTALTFNSERNDTDSIHDTTTNTNRLTCNTAGRYVIAGTVEFGGNATGLRLIIIRINGTTEIARQFLAANAGTQSMSVSTLYTLAVTDYVELVAYQSSGGALNVNAAANYSPEFSMAKVGD